MILTKVRKWGNSLGVSIPKEDARELMLGENEEVAIEIIKKENVLKELFGSGRFSKPTEHILKDIRGKESKFV